MDFVLFRFPLAVNFSELDESILVSKLTLRLCFNFDEKPLVILLDEKEESPTKLVV